MEKLIARQQLDIIHAIASIKAKEQAEHTLTITYKTLVAATIISWNCIFMFVVEFFVEFGLLFKIVPYIPFRLDFLSLTALSTVLAIQAIRGVRQGEIEVTVNALVMSAAVELCLILGDIVYLAKHAGSYPLVIVIRVPFMILTTINFGLVSFLAYHNHWIARNQAEHCERKRRKSIIATLLREMKQLETTQMLDSESDAIEIDNFEELYSDDEGSSPKRSKVQEVPAI